MKRIVHIFICLFLSGLCNARIITVDNDGPADFNNIQAAINGANDGDTVVVADGIYTGPGNRDIDFLGKTIIVRSEKGPTNCIIDCGGNPGEPHGGFRFQSGEDLNSVIRGFTVMGAYANSSYIQGATFCYSSNPTITNCIFHNNTTEYRGAAVLVVACMLRREVEITNCTFHNNIAARGSAVHVTGGYGDHVTLRNCIVQGNSDPELSYSPYAKCGVPYISVYYSVLQSNWSFGEHNIVADPCFADPNNGDYHLKSQAGRWDPNTQSWVKDNVTSVAIDAGDPASPIGLEPFPNGGIINMGAYGGTAEASKSYFGEPVCETIVAGDINGDCKVDLKDFALMGFHWLDSAAP